MNTALVALSSIQLQTTSNIDAVCTPQVAHRGRFWRNWDVTDKSASRHESMKPKERMPRTGQALTAVKYTTALRQGCDMKHGSAVSPTSPHNLKAEVSARRQRVERVP
ncbi:Uncharacterized protein HZ326_24100 [Fusarium oxysporum f. sp. albedinis]|nr:Uncharacterized protein HZ326_24100 [Fusarium oxysporum f. sp. albedinis]